MMEKISREPLSTSASFSTSSSPPLSASFSPSKPHSLRRRLLAFLVLAITFFAVLQGAGAYRAAVRQADQLFDQHLLQTAHAMRPGGPPPQWNEEPGSNLPEFEIQIWGPDGVQLFRSPRSGLPQSAVLGFSDVTVRGTSYRVYTVQTPAQTVQIAQDVSARNAQARAMALRAVLPVALMAPLLMFVIWWVINASLAPLERTRRQVARRAADDLSPLSEEGLPDEVRPLVHELNLLFDRAQAAFEAQRSFVADAAHELRSPLTALKLQASALRKSMRRAGQTSEISEAGDRAGSNPAAQPFDDAALSRLEQGVARATHLVEQLMTLARAEAGALPAAGVGSPAADLHDVIRRAVADVLPLAQARGIDVGLVDKQAEAPTDAPADTDPASFRTPTPAPTYTPSPAPVRVAGELEALRTLLRNLLDNAVKFTPAPGRVDVMLEVVGNNALLAVEDSGPGVAEIDRERMFGRFVRAADGEGAPTGSGLGLAIVRAIAAQHGGSVALSASSRLGGLRVECTLPLARPGVE